MPKTKKKKTKPILKLVTEKPVLTFTEFQRLKEPKPKPKPKLRLAS